MVLGQKGTPETVRSSAPLKGMSPSLSVVSSSPKTHRFAFVS